MQDIIKWGVRAASLLSAVSLISNLFGYSPPNFQTGLDAIMVLIWIHMEWEIRHPSEQGN